MKRFPKPLRILIGIIAVLAILWFGQRLLMPKYVSDIREGSMIAEYYDDEKDHDVVFVGDCEVYENISPITLWEDYGITSYIRGSAQQLIWQSYYLLEETFKYETPKVVVFNVLSMKYGEPQNEAYNRMSIDGMKLSSSKWNCIQASMTEDEEAITYLFPLLRYHSRWNELTTEDFQYIFSKKSVTHSGYLMRVDVKPVGEQPPWKILPDYNFSDVCYDYLERMRLLCEEHGTQFVLMKAPTIYPVWYDEWEEQMEAYAEEHGLLYLNFLELVDEIGIDYSTDTYDAGLHLNLAGAEKLSRYFGPILVSECGLTDRRGEPETAAVWDAKAKAYYEEKEDQYRELEEFGYLKSYGVRAPEAN